MPRTGFEPVPPNFIQPVARLPNLSATVADIRELRFVHYDLERSYLHLEKSHAFSGFEPVTLGVTVPNATSRPWSQVDVESLILPQYLAESFPIM